MSDVSKILGKQGLWSVLSLITRAVFLRLRDWLCSSFSFPLLLRLRFPGDNCQLSTESMFGNLSVFLGWFSGTVLSRWKFQHLLQTVLVGQISITSQLLLSLKVEGTAQHLLQLQPTVTLTMDGLMGLRAPTSATCTSRWVLCSFCGWLVANDSILVDQDQAYSACFPGGGGYPDYSCDPARFYLSFISSQKLFKSNHILAQLNLYQPSHPTFIEQANPNCYLDCYDSYCCQVFIWL